MFEVGFRELLVIAGLALVVLGPEKLPKLVGEIGRWMGRARAMARQFREQLEEEAAEVQRKAETPPVAPPVSDAPSIADAPTTHTESPKPDDEHRA